MKKKKRKKKKQKKTATKKKEGEQEEEDDDEEVEEGRSGVLKFQEHCQHPRQVRLDMCGQIFTFENCAYTFKILTMIALQSHNL
ncbi:hypothetical protein M8J76_006640 [Diaphorina citri]|nr:hypothetical protein M8J76_006640 [Diaphorina citri]